MMVRLPTLCALLDPNELICVVPRNNYTVKIWSCVMFWGSDFGTRKLFYLGCDSVSWPQYQNVPDSKVHGSSMGPIWGRQDPGGPNVGPMNFAIWSVIWIDGWHQYYKQHDFRIELLTHYTYVTYIKYVLWITSTLCTIAIYHPVSIYIILWFGIMGCWRMYRDIQNISEELIKIKNDP